MILSDKSKSEVIHGRNGKEVVDADDEQQDEANDSKVDDKAPKRKRKRKNRHRAAAEKLWIYVTGLPSDITVEEIKAHFSKVVTKPHAYSFKYI